MKRILQVGSLPPPYGGISVHIKRLKRILKEKGYCCYVLSFKDKDFGKKDVIYVNNFKKLWAKNNFFIQLTKVKPNIIHYHHTGYDFKKDARLLSYMKIIGSKIFITFHGGDFHPDGMKLKHSDKLFLDIILRLADKIICVNNDQFKLLKTISSISIDSKINVISAFLPPCDKPTYDDILITPDLRVNSLGTRQILLIGSWKEIYGIHIAIEAIKILLNRNLNVVLVLVVSGLKDPIYKKYILELIVQEHLQDKIMIYEDVNNVVPYLKSASLFIRPTYYDGDSVSLKEAIWFGIPVIASDSVNRPDGVFLFKNKNAKDLAKKIEFLLKNDASLNLKNHLIKVRSKLNEEVRNLIELYEEVLVNV